MCNLEFNCQNSFKQESSKNVLYFHHTKQESSKTTVAGEGSIKIEMQVLTPKSSNFKEVLLFSASRFLNHDLCPYLSTDSNSESNILFMKKLLKYLDLIVFGKISN